MKNSKKLIAAVAALVVALAVSVGSTFAWFTTNNTVTVSGINAQVTTGDSNLEVALITPQHGENSDATIGTFKYDLTLTADDLKWYDTTTDSEGLKSVLLDAVTSDDSGKTLTAAPKLDYDKGTATKGDAAKRESYVELFFRFRTSATDANAKIYLTTDSIVTSETDENDSIVAWESISANTYGTEHAAIDKDKPIAANAANTVRMAILPATFTSKGAEGTPQYSSIAIANDATGKVWVPNKGKGFDGKYKDNLLAEAYEIFRLGAEEEYQGESYENAVKAINQKYTQPTYTNEIIAGDTIVFTLDKADGNYYYTDVCIRFWIEGTDGECFNNIFNDLIEAKLVFSIKKD